MVRPEIFTEAAARSDGVSLADLLHLHGRATWPALLLVLAVLATQTVGGDTAAVEQHQRGVGALAAPRARGPPG